MAGFHMLWYFYDVHDVLFIQGVAGSFCLVNQQTVLVVTQWNSIRDFWRS